MKSSLHVIFVEQWQCHSGGSIVLYVEVTEICRNDILFGGLGNDTLTGGTGLDIFEFSVGSANDTIKDYNKSEGDQLKFYLQLYFYETIQTSFSSFLQL